MPMRGNLVRSRRAPPRQCCIHRCDVTRWPKAIRGRRNTRATSVTTRNPWRPKPHRTIDPSGAWRVPSPPRVRVRLCCRRTCAWHRLRGTPTGRSSVRRERRRQRRRSSRRFRSQHRAFFQRSGESRVPPFSPPRSFPRSRNPLLFPLPLLPLPPRAMPPSPGRTSRADAGGSAPSRASCCSCCCRRFWLGSTTPP